MSTAADTNATELVRAEFEAMIDRLVTLDPAKIRGILGSIPDASDDVRMAMEFFCNPEFNRFVSNTVWEIVK